MSASMVGGKGLLPNRRLRLGRLYRSSGGRMRRQRGDRTQQTGYHPSEPPAPIAMKGARRLAAICYSVKRQYEAPRVSDVMWKTGQCRATFAKPSDAAALDPARTCRLSPAIRSRVSGAGRPRAFHRRSSVGSDRERVGHLVFGQRLSAGVRGAAVRQSGCDKVTRRNFAKPVIDATVRAA